MTPDAPPPGVDSILTIDLDAIAENYRLLCARARTAEVAAVVKADAYGIGAGRVAPALAKAGCKTFFVATIAEGAVLRETMPDTTIAILNGCTADSAKICQQHNLVPVLNSREQLADWRAARPAAQSAILHVDTGMGRLGLSASEVEQLAADPATLAGVRISHVMSHLACADQPDHPLNAGQLEAFRAAQNKLAPVLGKTKISLANSSGIFLGPDYHFDLVRPGAALYGLAPTLDRPNPLRQTVHLHSRILQVREIDESATVGYGATHRAARTSRIATVAIGYADGYPRALGNCGHACVGTTQVPVVGRVSMDLTTLDVTDLPIDAARPGTFVELLGNQVRTDDLGATAGTIGYELLTRLGRRHHRVYR